MIGLMRRLLLHTVIVVLVLALGFATGMLVGWLWPPTPPIAPPAPPTSAKPMPPRA